MMRRLLDKARLSLLRALLPKDEKLKEEVAKLWLPRSPHSIWLGWDDVDMGGKRIRRVGTPVLDDDVARKRDVEQVAMPVGEAGDMIYHDGEKWTALKAPAAEKWLKHPGDGAAPEWADIPAAADVWGAKFATIVPQSLDAWDTSTSGSASIGYILGFFELCTGSTADSTASLSRILFTTYTNEPTNTRERGQIQVRFSSNSGQKVCISIFAKSAYEPGSTFTGPFVGFWVINDELYAVHKKYTDTAEAPTTHLIETFSAGYRYLLEIEHTPEPRARFYVNRTLVYETTENLPTYPCQPTEGLCVWIKNTESADKRIRIHWIKRMREFL